MPSDSQRPATEFPTTVAQPSAVPAETVDSLPAGQGASPLPDEAAGNCIGPYKLVQKLGEGGMDVVWVAEQTDAWTTFNSRSVLGGALLEQKKYADAEPLLLDGYEGMKRRADKVPARSKDRVVEAAGRLVRLYEAQGKAEEAGRWRKELEKEKEGARPGP
jgi:hypothetical protein